jgi:hypothetical protein
MKDIEKLLRMTERPQDYSDEEIRQMMSDPDMRAYYELMVDAEAGFAHKKGKKEPIPMIFKMAAMFIGLLLLSGIAFATYHYAFGNGERTDIPTQETRITNIDQQSLQQETASCSVRIFENAELQQILQELSEYYHVGVVFHNEKSRHIRLYTKWDTTSPLHLIIERLNGFEKVSIHLTENQIIAE